MKSTFLHFKYSKTPVYFGILLPLMMLLKPQVKSHIKQECVKITSGTNSVLVKAMDKPCKLIAKSMSDCIIKEAEKSGKILSIVSDLFSKNYGEASEAVTKKCVALTLGLPKNSLDKLPLAALLEAMQNSKEKNKDSDIEDVKREQNEILEDIPEDKPDMLEPELNTGSNPQEESKSDGQNKNKYEQDTLEDSKAPTYKKEMPKFKL